MASLKDISMSDLAKNSTGLGLVKSGVSKNNGEKTPFVDPFTLGVQFAIEITGEEITTRQSGSPQVALGVSIIQADGNLVKAGKVWLDLPLLPEAVDMTAEDEATYLLKSGEKFLRFLRAIDPVRFNVFVGIDKSNPKKWVYTDAEGIAMTEKARTKRADEIDAAVVAVAQGLIDGTVSLTGVQCYLTKVPNPNNAKYPFMNFSSEKK